MCYKCVRNVPARRLFINICGRILCRFRNYWDPLMGCPRIQGAPALRDGIYVHSAWFLYRAMDGAMIYVYTYSLSSFLPLSHTHTQQNNGTTPRVINPTLYSQHNPFNPKSQLFNVNFKIKFTSDFKIMQTFEKQITTRFWWSRTALLRFKKNHVAILPPSVTCYPRRLPQPLTYIPCRTAASRNP